MPNKLAVVGCSQLITLAGPAAPRSGVAMREIGIVPQGALFVRDGRIERVGVRSEIEPLIDAACEVVEVGDCVVLPGFVDAHTHPVFAGQRADEFELRALGASYQEIAAAGGGIKSTVRKTRAASEDELVAAGQRYAAWFLRCGTTTIEAKSGYGLTTADELKMLRAIKRLNECTPLRYVPTFLGAHTAPDEFKERSEAYVELVIEEMLPQVAQAQLAEYCDVFCEAGAFSVAESRRILTAAKRLGLGLRVHADQLSLNGGAALAAELGAATADHLEHADAAGIARLKAANVQPVLLPASVLLLGAQRYPAARAMIEVGLPLVLATDFNPGSSPVASMLLVLALACTQMKLTPAEAITAATINAAYSLGRGHELGSLEAGKRADFVIYDCRDYRELTYFAGLEHPAAVYVDGQLAHKKAAFGTSR